ncbi:MAG: imidazole glycerol phosphate synthase subunit HisH [Desulfomonilaceae bacterium]
MIVIIDYGMGNLRSVQKGFERVGSSALVSRNVDDIVSAEKLVLPGVGAFPECMKNLAKFGLVEPVLDFLQSGNPFLGICLGLQLLFDESEEFGLNSGLRVIPGKVKAFDRTMGLKIPHMGWNQIIFERDIPIFRGIDSGSFFYFVHSFYVAPDNASDVASLTDYGITFTSAIARDNIFAVQFHPEKSQKNGLKILENFSRI